MNKNCVKAIKWLMAAKGTDHDLPSSLNVWPVRSPWVNVNVNCVCQLLDKWGGGVYIQGWRVVFKGLVASTKAFCSAPCLLNRAKLIWICLGVLLSSHGRLSPFLFLSFFHLNLSDSLSGSRTRLLMHIHFSQKKCWPFSQTFVHRCQYPSGLHVTPFIWMSYACLSVHSPPHHHLNIGNIGK